MANTMWIEGQRTLDIADPAGSDDHVALPEYQRLSEADLSQVRFGRSRFLKRAGGIAFSLAVFGLLAGRTGKAFGDPNPIPYPCDGPSGQCDCCNSNGCCTKGCTQRVSGCGPYGVGWLTCAATQFGCIEFFCHDFWDYGIQSYPYNCTCSTASGPCTPGTPGVEDKYPC